MTSLRRCVLCSREFELKTKGHRALYCTNCRKGKKKLWKKAAQERRASTIVRCAVCREEVAGSRKRSSTRIPEKSFCPMCFLAINSRRSPDQLRKIAELLENSAPKRRIPYSRLDSPPDKVLISPS